MLIIRLHNFLQETVCSIHIEILILFALGLLYKFDIYMLIGHVFMFMFWFMFWYVL